jgi:transcriptional regulator with XRE-family HTH domain
MINVSITGGDEKMTVKEAREAKGMTQVELAAKCGVALNTIARLENGKMEKMVVGNLLKICKALDYDASSLFAKND